MESLPSCTTLPYPSRMATERMRVIGIAGWSGAGKTTLLAKLIPALRARGLAVATVKHAHHSFDVDTPGKDSWVHREAGAQEVILSSSRRWVQMHELREAAEPRLADLLRRLTPCDLVLVEGFKQERLPKLEVFRAANGRPPLHPDDPDIVAVASDTGFPDAAAPVVPLDAVEAIVAIVIEHAGPLATVLERLDGHGAAD
jgi:molybdopterin-guanine dinucleotide biosynthesis protein B